MLSEIIATSHVVDQTVLTPEALAGMASSLSDAKRKPAILVEHDHACPPMGQVVGGVVRELDDGHHALIGSYDVFDAPTPVELPDGTLAVQQRSGKAAYPFMTGVFRETAKACITVDPVSLGGVERSKSFLDEVVRGNGVEAQCSTRRSVLPDPELIVTIGPALASIWVAAKLGEVVTAAAAAELKTVGAKAVAAAKRMTLEALPGNRPITYVLQVSGQPNLEFVAKTRDPGLAIKALAVDDYRDLKPKIASLHRVLRAEMIQFLMNKDGVWEFNFLLTADGRVIGTREAFDRRTRMFKAQLRRSETNDDSPGATGVPPVRERGAACGDSGPSP